MRFIAEYTEEDGYEGDFHYSQDEIEDIRDFEFHLATSLSLSLNRIADDLYADDPGESKKFCQSIFDLAKVNYIYTYDHHIRNTFGKMKLSKVCYTDVKELYYTFLV